MRLSIGIVAVAAVTTPVGVSVDAVLRVDHKKCGILAELANHGLPPLVFRAQGSPGKGLRESDQIAILQIQSYILRSMMAQTEQVLDQLDRRLIALLRSNSREPTTTLAHKLNVTRATVTARIERLQRSGVILGFTARLAVMKDEGIHATTLIKVDGKAATRLIRTLQGYPEVAALHATNGRWDLVARLEVGDLQQLETVLREIRMLPGVVESETNIHLSQKK